MKKNKSGFTLTELIVAMGIIAILAALLMPAAHRARQHVRKQRCKTMIASIEMALEMYRTDFGVYPPTGNRNGNTEATNWGATPPIVNLYGALTTDRRGGPYIGFRPEELRTAGSPPRTEILDPWKNPYVFVSSTGGQINPPWHNTRTFDIYSRGPDGVTTGGDLSQTAGTGKDDINNW